jgi:rhodanese-related sulfurtransferase
LVEARREGKFSYHRLAGKEAFQIWQSIRDFAAVKAAEVQRLSEQYLHSRDELEALSIAELRRRLATGDVVLIDVRPEAEYRAAHIPGALSVPVEKLSNMLRTLPHDQEIVAYCREPFCLFSHEAVLKLKKKGFEARRLKLGLPDWRFAGLAVNRPARINHTRFAITDVDSVRLIVEGQKQRSKSVSPVRRRLSECTAARREPLVRIEEFNQS